MIFSFVLVILGIAMKKEHLSIYSFNATSISGTEKLSTFNNSFSGHSYDLNAITETWFHDGIYDEEVLPNCNYDIFRRDRCPETSAKESGGGIMLAVHKSLPAIRRREFETTAEMLWVHIPLDHARKAYVGTYYLPVKNNAVLQAIEQSITTVTNTAKVNDTIIMLGDYNLPSISWHKSPNYSYALAENRTEICSFSDHFLEILDSHGLYQYNVLPTSEPHRDRSTVNNHILDLVIGNELDDVRVNLVDNATTSTHRALEISARVNCTVNITPTERVAFNYKRVDWNHMLCLLSCIFWADWSTYQSVDDAYDHFYDVLYAVIKQCIPTFNIKNGRFPPWYSKELKSLVKSKERARRKYLKSERNALSDLYLTFSRLRKEIKRLQKVDWSAHINNVENSIIRNPKKFWSHVKSLKSGRSIPAIMNLHGVIYNTTDSIVKGFRLFFKSVFIQYDATYMPHCELKYTPTFCMPPIDYNDVRNILRSLQPSTCSGYDNISATVLIKCADLIAKPIADLFNLSIARGEYPAVLKRDHVVPIFKRKGSKNCMENYRGISIQPILAKVFEGFVNRALRSHLYPLINTNQHGFLKNKSCATNLLCYSDFISKCFDEKCQTHTIYTDFKRAFDVVPHELLLLKINRQFGIHDNMLRWFTSYLHGRSQRVVLNGKKSDWYSVTSGVPQGSKLGPTLFLMYMNDVFDCISNSNLLCFADDCKIYKKISNEYDCILLQDDINSFHNWCTTWCMHLHPDKCYFMNFSLKKSRDIVNTYSFNDLVLKRVYEMKDLGVYFTPNLNFSTHINKVTSKAMQMLGFLKRVTRDFTNVKTLNTLYNSLVRSRLEYCSQVWNPSPAAHVQKLERVQKKFLRYLSYKSGLTYNNYAYEEICVHFKFKTLQSRRSITDLVFLNKILTNNINCPYLVGEVTLRVPRRTLRDKSIFYVNSRLICRRDSFMPRTLALANKLTLYDELVMRQPADFKKYVTSLFI